MFPTLLNGWLCVSSLLYYMLWKLHCSQDLLVPLCNCFFCFSTRSFVFMQSFVWILVWCSPRECKSIWFLVIIYAFWQFLLPVCATYFSGFGYWAGMSCRYIYFCAYSLTSYFFLQSYSIFSNISNSQTAAQLLNNFVNLTTSNLKWASYFLMLHQLLHMTYNVKFVLTNLHLW